jgi:hypothetical protein
MRRLLAVAAATLLAMSLTAAPAHAQTVVGGGTASGTANDGGYYAHNYFAGNADVTANWESWQVHCADAPDSGMNCGGHLWASVNNGNLPQYQGHNVCVQVAIDWDTPLGSPGNHYDDRVLRNCEEWSTHWLSGLGGYPEPNPECLIAGLAQPCSMPAGRVQIARYVPALDTLVNDSKQCWYRESGHTLADCQAWNPTCPAGKWACRGWIKQMDGSTFIRDGGSPTYWDG